MSFLHRAGAGAAARCASVLCLTALLAACAPGQEPAAPAWSEATGALSECKAAAGTYSGVSFSVEQASWVSHFVDAGSAAQLDAVPYIGPTLASAIIAGRPYASSPNPIAKLDAQSGVGAQVLTALRDNVTSLWCASAPCCTSKLPPVAPAQLLINEFSPGSAGWVEIYNPGAAMVELNGWKIDDIAGAGAAPKAFPNWLIDPKTRVVLPFGGVNTASSDSVRLIAPDGSVADAHDNFYTGKSLTGQCFGRAGDGASWASAAVPCSKAQPNPGASPASSGGKVLINEFSAGGFGWIELYNSADVAVSLAGWSVDDIAGGSLAKVFGAGATIPPKGYFPVAYAGISASSPDEVRLLDAGGAVVEARSNGFDGSGLAGRCFGRLPDGGPWAAQALSCTQGAANALPAPSALPLPLVLNELSAGPQGWIELYNPTTQAVTSDKLWLRVASLPKTFGWEVHGLLGPMTVNVPAKGFLKVPFGNLAADKADEVELFYNDVYTPNSRVKLDAMGNFYQGTKLTGQCFGKKPDGGAPYAGALPCTPGAANAAAPSCSPGAACNDGDPCTYGEVWSAACACTGGKAQLCNDGNPCTQDSCSLQLGCQVTDAANGTACGNGQACYFGTCAGTNPNVCTATGGTYKSVAFSKDEECKALAFINKARSSDMALTTAHLKVLYDCTPVGSCGYRAGAWTSLAQVIELVGTCSSVIGATTLTNLKAMSANWQDDGLRYDTVKHTWENKAALVNRIVTLEKVWVEKSLGAFGSGNCWQVRDAPGAANYMTACFSPDVWCDGCMQSCSADCLSPFVGKYRWIRGTLEKDGYVPGGYKVQILKHSTCGLSEVQQAANPAL